MKTVTVQKNHTQKRPAMITMIVFVNILGWLTTEGVWVYLHLTNQIPPLMPGMSYWERAYIGLVYGFTVADATWSNLTLLFSIIGLWRMRAWGWTAAMMANTIWLYSMTFTLVRDLNVGMTGTTIFFLFFMAFAAISSVYLWLKREDFWRHSNLLKPEERTDSIISPTSRSTDRH